MPTRADGLMPDCVCGALVQGRSKQFLYFTTEQHKNEFIEHFERTHERPPVAPRSTYARPKGFTPSSPCLAASKHDKRCIPCVASELYSPNDAPATTASHGAAPTHDAPPDFTRPESILYGVAEETPLPTRRSVNADIASASVQVGKGRRLELQACTARQARDVGGCAWVVTQTKMLNQFAKEFFDKHGAAQMSMVLRVVKVSSGAATT